MAKWERTEFVFCSVKTFYSQDCDGGAQSKNGWTAEPSYSVPTLIPGMLMRIHITSPCGQSIDITPLHSGTVELCGSSISISRSSTGAWIRKIFGPTILTIEAGSWQEESNGGEWNPSFDDSDHGIKVSVNYKVKTPECFLYLKDKYPDCVDHCDPTMFFGDPQKGIPPSKISNFKASDDLGMKIKFTWSHPKNGERPFIYDIYEDSDTGGKLIFKGAVSGHIVKYDTQHSGTFYVIARNPNGESISNKSDGVAGASKRTITLSPDNFTKSKYIHKVSENSYEFTVPNYFGDIVVHMQGAGGSGSSAHIAGPNDNACIGGGSSGQYIKHEGKLFSSGEKLLITVGRGGSSVKPQQVSGADGEDGEPTVIGSIFTASGGKGGEYSKTSECSFKGDGEEYSSKYNGKIYHNGKYNHSCNAKLYGGEASDFGGGGSAGVGIGGQNAGVGAGGGSAANRCDSNDIVTGGNGGDGLVIIEWYE